VAADAAAVAKATTEADYATEVSALGVSNPLYGSVASIVA
jgi:hypothetical protein